MIKTLLILLIGTIISVGLIPHLIVYFLIWLIYKPYGINLMYSFDQHVNTLFGGDPDETISSRIGKWARDKNNNKGLRKPVYKVVNFIVELFEKDHFKKSIEEDEGDKKTLT